MVTAINLASIDHFSFQVNKDGVRQQECYDGGHKHSHQQKIGASLISTQVFQFINTLATWTLRFTPRYWTRVWLIIVYPHSLPILVVKT